jgi:CRISPR/Cas system-associated exonuclease Cas4 (RecB family)
MVNLPKNPKWYLKLSADPIEDMLEIYDKIIGDYLKLTKKGNQLLIATGLSQIPYDMVKFYYRLKKHETFLNKINIKFTKLFPRMTRDFEVLFDNHDNLIRAKNILENIKSKKDNLKIFGEIEIREKSLFVTLTYPHEIKKDDYLFINEKLELNFFDEVVFVAIKNGMHNSKGYVYFTPSSSFKVPEKPVHVSYLHDIILKNF